MTDSLIKSYLWRRKYNIYFYVLKSSLTLNGRAVRCVSWNFCKIFVFMNINKILYCIKNKTILPNIETLHLINDNINAIYNSKYSVNFRSAHTSKHNYRGISCKTISSWLGNQYLWNIFYIPKMTNNLITKCVENNSRSLI